MRDFHLHAPTRLFFGKRSLAKAGRICSSLGHERLLLVTGKNAYLANTSLEKLSASLQKRGIAWRHLPVVAPNPSMQHVANICEAARAFKPQALFALGGGSVIDATKIAAAALGHDTPPWELFLAGKDVQQALPLYAASTLAGSGSEMNSEAVARNAETREMRGIRGPALLPQAAFVDPGLQAGLSWELTRQGAVDMFCHVMERYVLAQSDDTVMSLAEALMRSILKRAEELRQSPLDGEARSDLCWSAILAQSGMLLACLAPGDWTVHVLAHSLAAQAPWLAHGSLVGVMLPVWLELLEELRPGKLDRWSQQVLGCASGKEGVMHVRNLFAEWGLTPSLETLGMDSALVGAAMQQAQITGNRHGGLGRAVPMQEHIPWLFTRSC